EGEVERVKGGNVLHRAGDIGGVGAALQLVDEPAELAHAVVDHAVERLSERGDGVAAVIAETVETAGDVFVSLREIAAMSVEAESESEGVAGGAFRLGAAEDGSEEHGLRGAGAVAERDTEAAVVEERERLERELA